MLDGTQLALGQPFPSREIADELRKTGWPLIAKTENWFRG